MLGLSLRAREHHLSPAGNPAQAMDEPRRIASNIAKLPGLLKAKDT